MAKTFLEDRFSCIAWRIFLGIIALNLAGTIFAPLFKLWGIDRLARFLYGFYHLTCHQLPSRSWFICGEKLGACARCVATYMGFIPTGVILFIPRVRDWIIARSFLRFILPLSILLNLPMVVDGLVQLFTPWESTNLLRLITGSLSGIGLTLFLAYIFLKVTRQADESFR